MDEIRKSDHSFDMSDFINCIFYYKNTFELPAVSVKISEDRKYVIISPDESFKITAYDTSTEAEERSPSNG